MPKSKETIDKVNHDTRKNRFIRGLQRFSFRQLFLIDFLKVFRNCYPCYWYTMPITADFYRRLMNSKTTITLSITVIAAIALLLVSCITNQEVIAANLCGSGLGCGHHGGYGFHHFFHHFFPYYGCSDCSDDYDYQLPFP